VFVIDGLVATCLMLFCAIVDFAHAHFVRYFFSRYRHPTLPQLYSHWWSYAITVTQRTM